MADAAASLRIEMLSIVFGSTLFIFIATPSTKINGLLFPDKVPSPLMFHVGFAPGSPPKFDTVIFKDGVVPCINCDMFAAGLLCRSSPLTISTEPVNVTLFWVAYPTATTSSNPMASTCIVTFIDVWLPIIISCVCIPTKENNSVAFSGILGIEYFPSTFVTVPVVVPFTITVTPISGCPVSSVTVPETAFCCCTLSDKKEGAKIIFRSVMV